jgi:hypothetical protein
MSDEELEVLGDDVPEYPEGEGDRDEYINSEAHRNIEDITDDELDALDEQDTEEA